MSLLLHQEQLGPTPFRHGREYRIQASWKFLYHVWFHQLLRCVSCSFMVHLDKSHLLQRFLKKHGVYLSGKPCEHRLRLTILAFVQSLFPWRWQQQVNPARTSEKSWPILCVIDVGEVSPGFIHNQNRSNASSPVRLSTISCNHALSISNSLPYE